MKTYILSLMAIMTVLSACKKDAVNKSVNNGKTTPVTFSVGFTKSTGTFNGAANIGKSKFGPHTLAVDTTLAKYVSVIYVSVYTPDGNILYQTKQLSTDTTFGTVHYNLPPGNYTVVFVAGQNDLFETSTTLNNTNVVYDHPVNAHNWQSTYYKKLDLTVGSSNINENVTLNHVDTQVVVDIEDAIPTNVKYIELQVTDNTGFDDLPYLNINTGLPQSGSTEGNVIVGTTSLVPGTKNCQIVMPLLHVDRPRTINIFAYDQFPPNKGTLISYYTVSNVTLEVGHQTILSGKLFGGNGLTNTGGFRMTIDPEWSPTTTTIPFQ